MNCLHCSPLDKQVISFCLINVSTRYRVQLEMAPVPAVTVPMNFGKRLLDSPTHNTLELRAKNGATVCASSVILSFNSPVIDHMTTTLHLTSIDVDEFSEEAVRYFVDAAYSGESPSVSRDLFRDVYKMSHVFKMSWLLTRLVEMFTSIAETLKDPSHQDLVFLFEEAAFVLTKLQSRQLVEIAFTKIRSVNGEQDFISKYLENIDSLSRQQLKLIVELAGPQVEFVVEPLTHQLLISLSEGEAGLSENCRYLLNECDLYSCQQHNVSVFGKLFDALEEACSSQEDLKWLFQMHRKVVEKPAKTDTLRETTNASSDCVAVPNVDEMPGLSTSSGYTMEDLKLVDMEEFENFQSRSFTGHENVILQISVSRAKHEKIKSKIAQIQKETKTRVELDSSLQCLFTITGNAKNCTEAKEIIQMIQAIVDEVEIAHGHGKGRVHRGRGRNQEPVQHQPQPEFSILDLKIVLIILCATVVQPSVTAIVTVAFLCTIFVFLGILK